MCRSDSPSISLPRKQHSSISVFSLVQEFLFNCNFLMNFSLNMNQHSSCFSYPSDTRKAEQKENNADCCSYKTSSGLQKFGIGILKAGGDNLCEQIIIHIKYLNTCVNIHKGTAVPYKTPIVKFCKEKCFHNLLLSYCDSTNVPIS